MISIIFFSILSFFATFGLIELIRFFYSEWACRNISYYTLIHVKNKQNEIECMVRNLSFKTEGACIIVVDMGSTDGTLDILNLLKKKYSNLEVFTYREYIDFLKEKG